MEAELSKLRINLFKNMHTVNSNIFNLPIIDTHTVNIMKLAIFSIKFEEEIQ